MDDGRPVTKVEIAASSGDVCTLKELFADGELDAKSEVALAALQDAAMAGQWEAVRFLVEAAGMEVCSMDSGGFVLQYASLAGRLDVMSLVVDRGASLKTRAASNALLSASSIGSFSIVEYLVKAGVDVAASGGEAAWIAAKAGSWDIVKFIILAGAELADGGRGVQLLAFAATQGQDHILAMLEEKGVDVKSEAGTMALMDMASTQDYTECRAAVKYLIEHGVVAESEAGALALKTAAKFGDLDMVQCILASGLQATSEAGGQALDSAGLLASAEAQQLVVDYLTAHGAIRPPTPAFVFDADF